MITAALLTLAACSWADPGADAYTGAFDAAIDAYSATIPATARLVLKHKVRTRAFDDMATITRDAIEGEHAYGGLRMMHFGSRGKVCATVDRSAWARDRVERGLVFCAAEHCVIIPTVCRNVSIVTRVAAARPDVPAESFAALADVTEPGTFADVAAQAAPEPSTFAALAALVDVTAQAVPEPGTFAGTFAGGGVHAPGTFAGGGVHAPVAAVPEPGTWALVLLGLAGICARRRT